MGTGIESEERLVNPPAAYVLLGSAGFVSDALRGRLCPRDDLAFKRISRRPTLSVRTIAYVGILHLYCSPSSFS